MNHKTQLNAYQNTIDRLRQTIAQAYGWLWLENHPNPAGCSHQAKNILFQKLDKDLQAAGRKHAREAIGKTSDDAIHADGAYHIHQEQRA